MPVGVLADLLRRRARISVEPSDELASATARVGVATADLYPEVHAHRHVWFRRQQSSVTSPIIRAAIESIGPGISWPIFNAGRVRATVNVQNEAQQQAMTNYEQTVLTALQDVEDSLVSYSLREQMRHRAGAQTTPSRPIVKVGRSGPAAISARNVVDFLTRRCWKRSDRSTPRRTRRRRSDAQIASNLMVASYKAMGGGWEVGPQG